MSPVLDHDAVDGTQTELAVLTVEFSREGSLCVLTMSGELNGTSMPALEVQIDQIGCSGCEDVVLDVTGLRALDRVARRVLVGLDHYVRAIRSTTHGHRCQRTGDRGARDHSPRSRSIPRRCRDHLDERPVLDGFHPARDVEPRVVVGRVVFERMADAGSAPDGPGRVRTYGP